MYIIPQQPVFRQKITTNQLVFDISKQQKMEDLANIQIVNKKYALTPSDLEKLEMTRGTGCDLQVVSEDVFDIEDQLGFETDNYYQQDESYLKKGERKKREYISMILNANRDPIITATRTRFSQYQDDPDDDYTTTSGEDRVNGLHRMYENVGDYDDYLQKNNFEEISPGRVYKLTRSPGVGALATDASLIIYNCALWTQKSKEPFDSTWMRRSVIVSNLVEDHILPGLKELLLTTKQGQMCEAIIRPEAAFGLLGAMPRIPPNASIFCLIEVVKVVTPEKMSILAGFGGGNDKLTFEDFYVASDQARQRGNYFYDSGQFKTAFQRYKSGIRLLEDMIYKDESEEYKAKDLLVKLYNNCARTANADGNPRLALSACKQASEINDMVPKTYWHRMTAWSNKGHFDRALGVARRAMQLFPEPSVNRQFMKAAEDLKLKVQKVKDDRDELYKLMGRAMISSTWDKWYSTHVDTQISRCTWDSKRFLCN